MLPSYSSNMGACSPPTPVIGEHAPLLLHGVGGSMLPSYSSNRGACSPPTPVGGEMLYYGVGGEMLHYGIGGEHAPLLLQ